MAKQEVKIGQTDYTVLVFIPDPASTDGSGKTGLVAADLTVSGVRVETDNDVTVTDYTSSLNNLSALTDTHNDWGLLQVSSSLAPGLYRLDIADAIFASGAWSAVVYVEITTSAAAASPMEFILIPQAPIDGVDVKSIGGTNQTARDLGASVLLSSGTGTGQISLSSGKVVVPDTQKVDVDTIKGNPVVNGGTITFPSNATVATTAGAVGSVTGAVGSVTGAVGSVTGNVGGSVASVVGAVGSVTGAVGSITGVTFPTNFADLSITASTGLVNITQAAADKAWGTATRVLTAGTNIVLPSNGLSGVSAWTVAITGNVTGNLSGSVGSVTSAVTITGDAATAGTRLLTALEADGAAGYQFTTLALENAPTGGTAPTANQNADALLDRANGIETGVTPRGTLRALLAALAGVATGGNTTSIVLKNPAGDTTRVTLTVDADGSRSASTLNV